MLPYFLSMYMVHPVFCIIFMSMLYLCTAVFVGLTSQSCRLMRGPPPSHQLLSTRPPANCFRVQLYLTNIFYLSRGLSQHQPSQINPCLTLVLERTHVCSFENVCFVCLLTRWKTNKNMGQSVDKPKG